MVSGTLAGVGVCALKQRGSMNLKGFYKGSKGFYKDSKEHNVHVVVAKGRTRTGSSYLSAGILSLSDARLDLWLCDWFSLRLVFALFPRCGSIGFRIQRGCRLGR